MPVCHRCIHFDASLSHLHHHILCGITLALFHLLLRSRQYIKFLAILVYLRQHTRALMVPCSACLWFLLNFGSVPLSEGYRWVFGFLILQKIIRQLFILRKSSQFCSSLFSGMTPCISLEKSAIVPVLMRLLRLIVLGRVLRFCELLAQMSCKCHQSTYWPWRRRW